MHFARSYGIQIISPSAHLLFFTLKYMHVSLLYAISFTVQHATCNMPPAGSNGSLINSPAFLYMHYNPHITYSFLWCPVTNLQRSCFLSNPNRPGVRCHWLSDSIIASGQKFVNQSIGGQICNLCKWDYLAQGKWFLTIDTLIVCGTSASRAKRERKKEILTSPVSPHEQSWSRGENFCVSMTTDGFKGFKGPRDVSGSPLHSLNCLTHPTPQFPLKCVYNVCSSLTVRKMTNILQNLFDCSG